MKEELETCDTDLLQALNYTPDIKKLLQAFNYYFL